MRRGCVFSAPCLSPRFLIAILSTTRDILYFSSSAIEKDVADLIAADLIRARIDHKEGVIIATKENKRREAIRESIKTQETFIWKSQSILLRHALVRNKG